MSIVIGPNEVKNKALELILDDNYSEEAAVSFLITASDVSSLLQAQQTAYKEAKIAMTIEALLRKAALAKAFPKDARKTGTNNLPLGNGWKLQGVFGYNYNVKVEGANEQGDPVKLGDCLEALIAHSTNGEFIVQRLIKYSPELSLTEYKLLTDEQKALLKPVLSVTDKMPELKLVAPKPKV